MIKTAFITWIEIKLFFRTIFKVILAIALPVMLLLLLGGITGMIDMNIARYIGIAVAYTGLMNLPLVICHYRESKVLKRMMATPVHPGDFLVSQVIVNYLVTILAMVILIFAGVLAYNLKISPNLPSVIGAFTLTAVCIFSMGFVIASIFKDFNIARDVSFILYFPMMLLATMPLDIMPGIVKVIANVLPLSYGIDLIRGAWMGGVYINFIKDIIVLCSVTIVAGTISMFTFRWE